MRCFEEFAEEISADIVAQTQVGSHAAEYAAPYLVKLKAPIFNSTLTLFALHTMSPGWGAAYGISVPLLPRQENFTITVAIPYLRTNKFRFAAHPAAKKNGFKLFGDPRVKCPFAEMEPYFCCETNDEKVLEELFDDEVLKTLLLKHKGATLTIQQKTFWSTVPAINNLPENVSLLMFNYEVEISRIAQLRHIYALVCCTFERLIELGLAVDARPGKVADGFLV